MFDLLQAENITYWSPVEYTPPKRNETDPDPTPVVFEVEFNLLGDADSEAITAGIADRSIRDSAVIARMCTGNVRGLTAGGAELPSTPETWARVLNLRGINYPLMVAGFKGRQEAAAGN